jgi:ABC-2 type transport system ATP-binding protein
VESGTDVLLTTQYLDEADQLARQIVIIDQGKAVAAGTPAELKRQIGGDIVELHVRHGHDLPIVAEMLARLGHGGVEIDEPTRRVSVRVHGGSDGLMTALQSAHTRGVELDDIGLRRPNLDEVFLALTGQPTTDDNATAARQAA